jgi:tripartite-type tricarboxylate transporter receptor subunit TctC
VLAKLRAAMAQVMAAPDVQELFAKSGGQVPKGSMAEQEAKVRGDIERWTKLIREAGVKGD